MSAHPTAMSELATRLAVDVVRDRPKGESAIVLLTDGAQRVEGGLGPLAGARIAVLDESTFEACASRPEGFERGETSYRGGDLTLAPFAVARFRLGQ